MIDIGPKPATCIQHVSFGWQKLASVDMKPVLGMQN